ncbi:MAG: dihydroorotase [Candidatus Neomarinimicrobiota bacterium]|nr:dihydroorotase [Candidatus Neomarinimicrobiota bacterium]RKY47830.1 MAG: dihydroorotase [Candidatus Neomarinimicrobiota bacterium]RKY53909.1 MAG: dihydroorotase [Candidatus Neomarinimicrobiota bacterium]
MEIKKLERKLLLTNCLIVDFEKSDFVRADILIENGIIKEVKANIEVDNNFKKIDLKGFVVSPGFIDVHVHFREPGYENAETLESGARAAVSGGFTQVCCMPNTEPPIDTQEGVKFVYEKSENLPVYIYPIAAITKRRAGSELTEMVELAKVGAVAFSDDGNYVQNPLVMRYAMEYSKLVDKPIVEHAEDELLKDNGVMNESFVSTRLGLKGNPYIAEEIAVYRDLALARFTGARIHIAHVTTARSVDLIRKAKKEGVKVTAEVTPHHLTLTDSYMENFDANGKIAPPLRSEEDVEALVEGLKDGTIDVIATDHAPHPIETKETTINEASSGIIGLESAFGLIMTNLVHKRNLPLIEILKKITINPAKIFGLRIPEVKRGVQANLTVFDPDEWWIFSRKTIYSKSYNTPFLGYEFLGRVKQVITKGYRVIV